MKELYTNAEVEVIEFDTKDVITTSGEATCPYEYLGCQMDAATCMMNFPTCDSSDDCDGIWSPEL